MPYPIKPASALADQLSSIASEHGGNVFVGDLQPDAHGPDYRSVTVDITRQDWHRIHAKLLAAGWRPFGDGGLSHDLPEDSVLVALPSF